MDVHRANRFIACIRQVVHLSVSQLGVVSFRKQRRKIHRLYYQLEHLRGKVQLNLSDSMRVTTRQQSIQMDCPHPTIEAQQKEKHSTFEERATLQACLEGWLC